jgi:pimeloyl-ACP methyl ester carboxylesterase
MPDSQHPSGFAALNGATLYYETAGSGPPLVLVHSGIADSRMWDDQWQPFSQHFQVVRYDLRGFGRSAPLAGEFSHPADLLALLDFLAISQAYLLGCSKGGSIVLDFTLLHPQRVAGMVLVTSSPGGFSFEGETPPQWDDLVAAFKQGDFDRTAELEVQIWVDGPHRTPEQVDPVLRARIQAMDRIALANEAQGLGTELPLEPSAASRLGEINVPALILYGDLDDPNIIRAAGFMAQHIPGAQKSLIPGTAHFPNMEQPERFNHLVLDFLSDLPAV